MNESYVKLIKSLPKVIDNVIARNQGDILVESKMEFDYVSNLDRELQYEVSMHIKLFFREDLVIGEESMQGSSSIEGVTWIIDPLDGTSNFLFGLKDYCVSIARVENGKVTFGYIYNPDSGEAFYAELGKGSFMNGTSLSLLRERALQSDFIGLSSGFIQLCAERCPSLLTELRKKGKFRLLGSQAIHLCYVACGRLKATINWEAKLWDDLAGAHIIQEAGGQYTALSGFDMNSIEYVDPNLNLHSVAESTQSSAIMELLSKELKRLV